MLTDLQADFPRLATEPYTRTSQPTFEYNCFAYAAGDESKRWDPFPGFYWPSNKRNHRLATLTKIYQSIGFSECSTSHYERGFDRIAIYAKNGVATHAAKQLSDGQWSSKLGDLDDITHTLMGLVSDGYGQPKIFMRRSK